VFETDKTTQLFRNADSTQEEQIVKAQTPKM